jgi:diaminopimelate epimerase
MPATGVVHLTKHHGAGNDFLVLLDADGTRPLSEPLARALCDRRRGVGADGVLRGTRGGAAAAVTMELRNADGGAAEMSGNGIRCFVQAVVEARWAEPGRVEVATAAGVRHVQYTSCEAPGSGFASVDMGRAILGADLPSDIAPGTRLARTVDMGNPHIVLLGDPVSDAEVADVGARLENLLESRANVEFIWPGPGPGELTLRVWERGVGITLACGTGTCAAVAAAHDWGVAGPVARVHNPGGTLEVTLGDDGIFLAGPTQKVADVAVGGDVLAWLTRSGP